MASEIRVDKITSLSGVGTITPSASGIDITGITTVATLKATTGIVTTLNVTGTATANAFVGDGSQLTGVASTENIRTNTNATFLQNINVSGTTTATGNINVSGANITLQDSTSGTDDRITFGASTDFEIFHNGTNNYIDCHTAGQDLYIRPTKDVYIQDYDTDDKHIKMVKDGAVELYHNNSKKLETYANGCTVTGNLNAGNVDLTDSAKARFGASNDLQIYHDGTDNYLESTGKLYIKSSNFVDIRSSGNETMIQANPNGAVDLYYDNSKKFETSSSGVTVTGQLTSTASNNGQIIHTFKNTDTTSSSSAMTVEQHFNFNRTGGGLNLSAAKIVAGKEREWVGAAANQDGYFAIHTTQNETSAEKIRVNSAGDLLYANNDRNYACWYKSPTNPSTSAATNSAGFLTYGTAVIANTDVYNTSNGRYTAPVDGLYLIRANGLIDNSSSTGGKQIHLYKNGSTYGAQIAYQTISSKNQGDYELMSGTGIMYMSAGDYAQVHASGGMHVSNETNLIVYLIRGTV